MWPRTFSFTSQNPLFKVIRNTNWNQALFKNYMNRKKKTTADSNRILNPFRGIIVPATIWTIKGAHLLLNMPPQPRGGPCAHLIDGCPGFRAPLNMRAGVRVTPGLLSEQMRGDVMHRDSSQHMRGRVIRCTARQHMRGRVILRRFSRVDASSHPPSLGIKACIWVNFPPP